MRSFAKDVSEYKSYLYHLAYHCTHSFPLWAPYTLREEHYDSFEEMTRILLVSQNIPSDDYHHAQYHYALHLQP